MASSQFFHTFPFALRVRLRPGRAHAPEGDRSLRARRRPRGAHAPEGGSSEPEAGSETKGRNKAPLWKRGVRGDFLMKVHTISRRLITRIFCPLMVFRLPPSFNVSQVLLSPHNPNSLRRFRIHVFLSKYARIPPSSAGGMNGQPSPLGDCVVIPF